MTGRRKHPRGPFGDALVRAIRGAGMTQRQVADALGIGDVYMSQVICGTRLPFEAGRVVQIAALTGADPTAMLREGALVRGRFALPYLADRPRANDVAGALAGAWPDLSDAQFDALLAIVKAPRR